MKKILTVLMLATFGLAGAQTNILTGTPWNPGSGNSPGFFKIGSDASNVREQGIGPRTGDANAVLWKCTPEGTSSVLDGGFYGGETVFGYPIDPERTYRISVWAKKTNSRDGLVLFGFNAFNSANASSSQRLNGAADNNPFFYVGNLPQVDTWYLLVGFVHPSGATISGNQGRMYDLDGNVVQNLQDFKFTSAVNRMRSRIRLFNDPNVDDNLFLFDPTMYEVNGQEPSIDDLLNGNSQGGGSSDGFVSDNGNLFLETGSLGIGTRNTSDFMLAVAGKTVTEEVQVSLEADWPDYVFESDFVLPTLEAVEAHIDQYGHLKDIPSALEVKDKGGIALGEMNAKLLQKIEELTLYLIAQDKRIKKLEQQLK
ncbi:MAG: hypothetical protein AAFZ89_02770 [Bacteroidota bacterium]